MSAQCVGHRRHALIVILVLLLAGASPADELSELGQQLFFDTDLSANRNQSCSSCHNPANAFSDQRDNGVGAAASLGSDGRSLGTRNAPAITYAALIPVFGVDDTGAYAGGLFHDGRAADLAGQAAEPFTNPIEMGLPDAAAVVRRVLEKPQYVAALSAHFGSAVLDETGATFRAITEAIAAYERSPEFIAFDSRYDRYLRGEYRLTRDEEIGRMLFFSQVINCHSCHLADARENRPREPFTTFRYHNIGVPPNERLGHANGTSPDWRDAGLLDNPAVAEESAAGKFRVPTLRNVAVTGPYMHNGVFRDLETAIRFYNRYTLTDRWSQTNPETGERWHEPEVPGTIDNALLQAGQPMSEMQVRAIVAFLRALTDQRYEHLVYDEPGAGAR